jgi:hypothetical protein
MAQNDIVGSPVSQQMMDLAAVLTADATGHSKTFRRTWEEQLGDTPEARSAAAAWRAWDIESPAVLLREEWFGGQIARFYDWMNPPDPCMRELFGMTYLDVAGVEWWELKWQGHVKFLQKLLAAGLSPAEAASVLGVAQKMSLGLPINKKALVRTARKYKKFGFPIHSKNIWILQSATTPELKKLHDSVIYDRKKRNKNELASEKSRKRAIRQTLKQNAKLEKFNASLHQLYESSGATN